LALLWHFGILPPDDPRIVSTIERIKNTLTVKTSVGGIARYTGDYYQSVTPPTADVPGNPWIITTLWQTQWKIAMAKSATELEQNLADIRWAIGHGSKAGLLPEQMHPFTGAPLSVAPLTWSHAVLVDTILQYAEKLRELTGPQK
jgi:GH15 family glucan-1,4-alpha-glucosidase